MKKEEVYLDLTKLTKEQLINVAESVKGEMFVATYRDLSSGFSDDSPFLIWDGDEWIRDITDSGKKEITYDEFLINFGKPKEPIMVTLPIEDYNRLRKLELKAEIKRLKKELKGL